MHRLISLILTAAITLMLLSSCDSLDDTDVASQISEPTVTDTPPVIESVTPGSQPEMEPDRKPEPTQDANTAQKPELEPVQEPESAAFIDSALSQFLTSDDMRLFESVFAVTAEQKRHLVFGAFIPTANRESIRILALIDSAPDAARLLRDYWSVVDRETALVQLENLSAADGQSPVADEIYEEFVKTGNTAPLELSEALVFGLSHMSLDRVYSASVSRALRMDEELEQLMVLFEASEEEREDVFNVLVAILFVERINDGLDAYQQAFTMLVRTFGYTEEELLNLPTLAAWDYGRTAFIARYGVTAGYLDEETAFEYMKIAADRAAETYSSWREYTAAYILGRALAYGNPSLNLVEVLDYLLNHPESPFLETDFRLN